VVDPVLGRDAAAQVVHLQPVPDRAGQAEGKIQLAGLAAAQAGRGGGDLAEAPGAAVGG